MTGGDAYALVYGAKAWLDQHGPARCIDFDIGSPAGSGDTHISAGGIDVRIGVSDIVLSPSKVFRDGEALLPFVSLFHEVAGHAMQLTHGFSHTNTLSKVLFLSQCACKGSAQYYGVDDNNIPHEMYFSQTHEIAAQYMGIKCGYAYLASVYPDDAEHMMLDYIAYRMENSGEFLPSGASFTTVDGALKAMNKEFQRRVEEHRDFEPVYDRNDALGRLADCNKHLPILEMVKNCRNGLRQDGMMACAFLDMMDNVMQDDNRFLKNTQVCRDLKLDIGKMFSGTGCPIWPPPVRPLTNLDRLRAITDEMDRNETDQGREDGFEKQ